MNSVSEQRSQVLPADQYVGHGGPLDGAVAAESEAGLAVDVLRVSDVRAVIALIDGHVYPCSFGVRLQIKQETTTTVKVTLLSKHDAQTSAQTNTFVPHHIVEDEAGMGEFEVFEQAVEFAAVQRTPGTVKIISRLGLLPCVIVVQELNKDTVL